MERGFSDNYTHVHSSRHVKVIIFIQSYWTKSVYCMGATELWALLQSSFHKRIETPKLWEELTLTLPVLCINRGLQSCQYSTFATCLIQRKINEDIFLLQHVLNPISINESYTWVWQGAHKKVQSREFPNSQPSLLSFSHLFSVKALPYKAQHKKGKSNSRACSMLRWWVGVGRGDSGGLMCK